MRSRRSTRSTSPTAIIAPHRAARTRRSLAAKGAGEHDRVLAVAFPDDQVQVLPYNRVVKDLNGMTCEAFLEALDKIGADAQGPVADADAKGPGGDVPERRVAHRAPEDRRPMGSTSTCSRRRSSSRCSASRTSAPTSASTSSAASAARRSSSGSSNSGAAAVAFSLYPVSVKDLMRIADAGGIMPPKSTWFEPKLRDGLLSHLI